MSFVRGFGLYQGWGFGFSGAPRAACGAKDCSLLVLGVNGLGFRVSFGIWGAEFGVAAVVFGLFD